MLRVIYCLHNWLINDEHGDDDEDILQSTTRDQYFIMNRGGTNVYQDTNVESNNQTENSSSYVLVDGGYNFMTQIIQIDIVIK